MSLFQKFRQLVQPTQNEGDALHGQLGKEIVAYRLPVNGEITLDCFACHTNQALLTGKAPQGAHVVHRGPYTAKILPQADIPELALHLQLVIDQLDNAVAEARFALFLHSELIEELSLTELTRRIQECVNAQVAQGYLLIDTCPSAAEWQEYRAQLEKLLFTRFGLSVEDCLPVDLAEQVDYASQLIAQELAVASAEITEPSAQLTPVKHSTIFPRHLTEIAVSRRMFLELPALCRQWRALAWPRDVALFARLQAVAQRMDLLEAHYASPPTALQRRQAQQLFLTLEQAWALLARLQLVNFAVAEAVQSDAHMAEIEALCTAWESVWQEHSASIIAPNNAPNNAPKNKHRKETRHDNDNFI